MMEQRKKQQLEEALSIQQKTLDLLPDAEVNLAKLQNVVEATAQRLINLATQWEHHRAPLFEQYRNLRELNANRVVRKFLINLSLPTVWIHIRFCLVGVTTETG